MVAISDSDAAGAESLADLADADIGVQIGTTSLEAVTESIEPSSEPQVFDTSNDVVSALENGQVDAVVVDTPTALYLTAVQVPKGEIVGEFSAPGGDEWGALLEKDSALTLLHLGGGRRAEELRRARRDPAAVDQRRRRRRHARVTPTDRRAERAAAKRSRDRRGAAIAAISTIVVLGGLVAFVVTSDGWADVRDKFFNGDVFVETFPDIAKAFWLDIRVFVVVEIAVLILGLGIALIRISGSPPLFPLRMLAVVYTDLFRGVPVILVVYLIGFGVPALDVDVEPVVLGGIGLTLCYTAYVAEVYRAGLRSVRPTQREAALAVGLSEQQAMRHVVLPQAVRNVGPPLLNDFISLQKDVALIAIIGVTGEAFREAQIVASTDFNYTPLLGAALLYLAVTVPMARLLDWWERRQER